MIHTFSSKNFGSFENRVVIDFQVDENAPKKGSYINTGNTRVSLVEAIIGPNASGKTTALKPLAFINWFLLQSFRHNRYEMPLMPFAGNKDDKSTEFSVEFETTSGIYTYELELTKTHVLKELLSIRNITNTRMTSKKLLSRIWNNESKKYVIDDTGFGVTGLLAESGEFKNTSFISIASRLGNDLAKEITDYWKCFETNVEVEDRMFPYAYQAWGALDYYEKHATSRKSAEKDVRRYADLGIDSFGRNGVIKHRFGDKTFDLELENESSGTRQYITLRRIMDRALDQGGIVVVDEFDAFLHPHMFASLIEKFLSPKTNKGHAQLLMTAQDPYILKTLGKDQINFAIKNPRGATTISRLDKMDMNVRRDDNHFAKYMKGVYGFLPKVPRD